MSRSSLFGHGSRCRRRQKILRRLRRDPPSPCPGPLGPSVGPSVEEARGWGTIESCGVFFGDICVAISVK